MLKFEVRNWYSVKSLKEIEFFIKVFKSWHAIVFSQILYKNTDNVYLGIGLGLKARYISLSLFRFDIYFRFFVREPMSKERFKKITENLVKKEK